MKTTVIELLGGPGSGKSTLAADIFVRMKQQGIRAELIPEHVKYWAWESKPVGPFDQIYLFGQQVRHESRLYGKVDYIISDSPVIMYPVYEETYQGHSIIRPSVLAFIQATAAKGILRSTFALPRVVHYEAVGRFETDSQVQTIDDNLEAFYEAQSYPHVRLGSDSSKWIDEIFEHLTISRSMRTF